MTRARVSTFSLLLAFFGLMAVCTALFAQQAVSIVEIGNNTVDHDRVVASRWQRIDFDSLISGEHTIRVLFEGNADIRFSVFDAADRTRIARNITEGAWTGNLDEGNSYYLGVWSASGAASFTATIEADTTALEITTQPVDLTVAEGSEATFSVSAIGSGALTYQWFVTVTETDPTTGDLVINPGAEIPGAIDSILTLSETALSDNGTIYFASVTDATGDAVNSAIATLTIEALPVSVSITAQPVDLTVHEGDDANFAVTATGNGTLGYQWFSDEVAIDGATNSNLRISPALLEDNGTRFSVLVTDSDDATATSDSATLSVVGLPPTVAIATQPADAIVLEGEDTSFTVSAEGEGTLAYQWFVDDVAIANATTDILLIASASLTDNGNVYRVDVSDTNGIVSSDNAVLTVDEAEPEPEPHTAVTIVSVGQGTLDSSRTAGPRFIRLDFDSLATASHTVTVLWDSEADVRFNVLDDNRDRVNSSVVRGSNPGVWIGELEANRQYSVALWSASGVANFTAIVEASVPLAINSQPENTGASEGGDAQFSVEAAGSGTLTYQWFADGLPLLGETTESLVITAVSLADEGIEYVVDVSNGTDTITSDVATLTIRDPLAVGPFSQEADTSTWILNGPAPTLDFNVSEEFDAWGRVLLRIGDVLLVGGDFNGIRPSDADPLTDRPWLAAFNAVSGQPVSTFQVPPEVDSVVRALALSQNGDRVFVGGDFGLLALNAGTGEVDFTNTVTKDGAPGRVFDIAVTPSQIYIGGEFSRVSNVFRGNIARLSLDGELDESWGPNVRNGFNSGREAPVQAVTVSPIGDTVYVGGNFRFIDDTPAPISTRDTIVSMLAVSADAGAAVIPERFLPDVDSSKRVRVRDIAVTDDYVAIAWGGPNYLTFHSLDGTRLRQYDGTGDVQALHVAGNLIFVGHHGEFFGSLEDPIPQEAVESIDPEIVVPFKLHSFRIDDPTFPVAQAWQIKGFFGVWGIAAAEDSIWITGQISSAGTNDHLVDGIARFPVVE